MVLETELLNSVAENARSSDSVSFRFAALQCSMTILGIASVCDRA
jgi:hypothetical protein